ncbi:hypothetical protein Avbf_09580 [Armadillidium vulgare]|nr:hypothetical protein Avbf_09580 [Armadillidium vulgare]
MNFGYASNVTGTLQQIQQSTSPPPYSQSSGLMQSQLPAKQYYNNPINLYSFENVAEVAKLNEMGVSGLPGATSGSPTGLLNPHRPQQVVFGAAAKDYNPRESATWLALQESDPSIDPEKLKNYSTLREHRPIYSEVYEAPKLALDRKIIAPRPAPTRISQNNPSDGFHNLEQTEVHTPVKSPVAEFLPPKIYKKVQESSLHSTNPRRSSAESQPSAVQIAALNEQRRPVNLSSSSDLDNIPIYETNTIGGRKRIAQSASFNKLMMDVLGQICCYFFVICKIPKKSSILKYSSLSVIMI